MQCGKKVAEAVDALKAFEAKKEDALIKESAKIHLVLVLKIIPDVEDMTIALELPHNIFAQDTEMCLFVKDEDKHARDYRKTVQKYEDLLKKRGITRIKKIIPLKSLKTEYKPYEAKRNLSNMYDVFLADRAIVRFLPAFLGKHFLRRKRFPVGLKIEAKNLKDQVESALKHSSCAIGGHGATCMAVVGHVQMDTNELQANVQAAVDKLAETLPGGWKNVKTLHLKTGTSPALTIYTSLSSSKDVELPEQKSHEQWTEAEDVTPIEGALVRVKKGDFKLVQGVDKEAAKLRRQRRNKARKLRLKQKKAEQNGKPETKNEIADHGKGHSGSQPVDTENVTNSDLLEKKEKSRGNTPPTGNVTKSVTKKRKLEDSEVSVAKKTKLGKNVTSKLQALKKVKDGKGQEPKLKTKGEKIKKKADLRLKTKSMQKQISSKKVIASKHKGARIGAKRVKQP